MRKIDFHVHINSPISVEETIANFRDMMERHGYDAIGIQSLITSSHTFTDYGCNERALQIKKALPGSYAFAALDHRRDFVEQTREYMKGGFDGIKLLEGKPNIYRLHGYGLESERFDRFFAYAEKEQVPIVLHNGDPELHWDITKAGARAIEKGWVYDETFPTRCWFVETLEHVLEKYPRLRIALAHMGFYSDNLKRAAYFMDNCPNLRMDITPAPIIYSQLSEQPDAAAFFRRYGDRIFYGTDADNGLTGFPREYNDKKVRIITAFLEGDKPRRVDDMDITPIHADEDLLQKIYADNAIAFANR